MNKTMSTIGAVAVVAGAIAVPTIAFGNARRSEGTLSASQAAEQPYVALLSGANEVPDAGDPDGSGSATVSIAILDDVEAEVCWDVWYGAVSVPTGLHIHRGAEGVAGPVVVDLGTPGPTAHAGCDSIAADLAAEIVADASGFYVNVHTAEFPDGAVRGQLTAGPAVAGSAHFLPVSLRAYDSREAPATKLAGGDARLVNLSTGVDAGGTEGIAVPAGATAAIVTLTATETDGPGFLTIYSGSTDAPLTSNLNFTDAGLSIAVSTQVAVDPAGNIYVEAGAAGTHFVVDVVGFYY